MVQTVAADTRWSRRVNDDEYMPNSMEDAGGTTTKLSINILGPLRVRRGGVVIGSHELGGPKPRQVLEILLLKLGTPVSKNHLIDVLWNGQPPAEALSTLESYVSVLRRHLQPGSGKGGALRTVTGGYMIDRSMVDLDLDRFDDLLKQAGHASPEESFRLLE